MSSPSISQPTVQATGQTTLLTSHKGVDLHAATALLVMKDRLEGGHLLEGLFRCEMHTFRDGGTGVSISRLLDVGRYFNPNKHHYGHFTLAGEGANLLENGPGSHTLDPQWPGTAMGSDLEPEALEQGRLYDLLLGGAPEPGISAVDVVSFPFGQEGPVLSGVLWRLLIRGDADIALKTGQMLAVASHRKEGLLINPHMENWLATSR